MDCRRMPTILMVQGWRFYFYANEGNEPMHVHAVKGDADCKYWIYADRFDIEEEFEYNCSPRLRREVRRIIFTHFDEICAAWRGRFGGPRQSSLGPSCRHQTRSQSQPVAARIASRGSSVLPR
jgi:Domain of unknown function (DUF4160)